MKLQTFHPKGLGLLLLIFAIVINSGCAPNIDKLKREGNVPKLVQALEYRKYPVRSQARKALGEIQDIDPFISALENEQARVRLIAAGKLGDLGDNRAVQPLIKTLANEQDINVIESITASLIELKISEEETELLKDTLTQLDDSDFDSVMTRVLKDIYDPETIITDGYDPEKITPWFTALAETGNSRSLEYLLAALDHREESVRRSAVDALAQIGEPAVEPLLIKLNKSNNLVRSGAAQALGKIGDPRAVEDLLTAALAVSPSTTQDYRVRKSAAQALVAIGKPGIDPLIAALDNSNLKVRKRALEALSFIGDSVSEIAMESLIAATRARTGGGGACADDLEDYINLLIDLGQHISNSTNIYAIENTLIYALNDCGTQALANKYLKSGNKRLGSAARDWAEENGYSVITVPSSGGDNKSWGSN